MYIHLVCYYGCMCVWTISFILLSVDTQPPGLVGDKTIPCRESLNRSSRSRLFYNFYSKERSSSTTTTLVRQVMKRRRITASQTPPPGRTHTITHSPFSAQPHYVYSFKADVFVFLTNVVVVFVVFYSLFLLCISFFITTNTPRNHTAGRRTTQCLVLHNDTTVTGRK